jgi:hypothetical protein
MPPLPSLAQTGLIAQLSILGLASCMRVHPEMDHFDDPSDNFPHESSIPSMLIVLGFKDNPNWDSDTSIWRMLKDTDDAKVMDHPKASNKKHKKQPHDSGIMSYGLMAIFEKVMREYLV